MAKKYLLYIHDERFQAEPEKSGLVNDLLDDYYRKEPILTAAQLATPPCPHGHHVQCAECGLPPFNR